LKIPIAPLPIATSQLVRQMSLGPSVERERKKKKNKSTPPLRFNVSQLTTNGAIGAIFCTSSRIVSALGALDDAALMLSTRAADSTDLRNNYAKSPKLSPKPKS
jgi:hypothetical protein